MQTIYGDPNHDSAWPSGPWNRVEAVYRDRYTTGAPNQDAGNTYGSVGMGGRDILIQGNNTTVNLANVAIQDEKQQFELLLASLAFERMDSRLHNVAAAMPRTGQWIFSHSQFLAWLNADSIHDHNGFLWIKGKPGSGKSTLMKEVLFHAEENYRDRTILHYFFNARAQDLLERSSIGLYRFILHQLVSTLKSTHVAFTTRFKSKITAGKVRGWTQTELCNFLIETLQRNLIRVPLVILVDALDEGLDEDVRGMVAFLEDLANRATLLQFSLRILFSSRHYPHISINKGLYLTLEDEDAHNHDIRLYVQQHLPITWGSQIGDLRHRVLAKSAGVFLWVVLVIPLLRQVHDRGGRFEEMNDKLESIPTRLHDLFTEILNHNTQELDLTFRLFRWVLSSFEQLRPEELYAICRQHDTYDFRRPTRQELDKFILHCSRGLVEVTKTSTPVVQFIHETIRDFLRAGVAITSQPVPYNQAGIGVWSCETSMCHLFITTDCLRYLLQVPSRARFPQNEAPLAWYAIAYWCEHARLSNEQHQFRIWFIAAQLLSYACIYAVDYLDIEEPYWLRWSDDSLITPKSRWKKPEWARAGWATRNRNVLHRATRTDLPAFVRWLLMRSYSANARYPQHWYDSALAAASGRGQTVMVRDLLKVGADVNALHGQHGRSALYKASIHDHVEIVRALLFFGAQVDLRCRSDSSTPLHAASAVGNYAVFRVLLDSGAQVDIQDPAFIEAVVKAAEHGHNEIIKHILGVIQDVDVHQDWYERSLVAAVHHGNEVIVKSLLTAGRKSYERKGPQSIHLDVLYAAFETKSYDLVDIMLDWIPENERLVPLHEVLDDALERGEWDMMTAISFHCGTRPLLTWPRFVCIDKGSKWQVCFEGIETCFVIENDVVTLYEEPRSDSPMCTVSLSSEDRSYEEEEDPDDEALGQESPGAAISPSEFLQQTVDSG